MNVGFYNFTKRENSTLQPGVGVVRDDFACKLKDNCSIISPIIELVVPTGYTITSLINYNYCYIQDFSRFYFVADKVFLTNNIIEYHLECDVLATYRQQIGAASEYVLRSASTYDTNVLDDLYPMNAEVSYINGTYTGPGVTPVVEKWNPFGASNMIILGIINSSNTNKNGAVTYYKISYPTLCNMMQYLLGSAGYFNLNPSEISDNLAKALVNPIQYITEAFYIPYDFGTPYNAEDLKMGWWDLPTDGNYQGIPMSGTPGINDAVAIASGRFYIPIHPQSSARGRYMRCAPWSRYMLYAGPFGNIPIDPATITNSDYINLDVYGNMFGDCMLVISNQYGYTISKHRSNVKHTFTIGQVNNDPASFISGVLGVGSGTIARGMSSAVGAIMSGASGIISNASNLYPQCQTFGTNSSGADNDIYWTLVGEFHNAVDNDNTHRGRPLCQVKTISTLSGYILVADADIAVPGTAEENEKIKAYMNGGFYYE